ncbi:hypothetical protein SADUNF_Sadunf16G0026000 [Salix dunnii]|uniref:DUF7036 domain-containing protein n=1 Tax=Salix dunnii TaxID=1413687 RepID=A0A835MP53_9ROSI|nr:hypothetical protein SADUNF_Sadunf16G0026000 [Salix dunnii]
MGKAGNGVNGSEEEQGIGTSGENREQNVERGFYCFGCKGNFVATRFTGFRCVFVLLLSVAVFLSAVFWLPPFLHFADQGDLDLDYRIKDHDIVASFVVKKPVFLLEDNILKLQNDIFDEMRVPNTKVVILSLEPLAGSNRTKVVFGVDPLEIDSKISSTDQSLIRGSFVSLVVNESSLELTKSLFGDASSFEVLKFPGGITIIPPQRAFLLQKVKIPFNFTLNFSILQIRENFAELKSQLKEGLHLTPIENLYIDLWNSQGSTVAPPTTVRSLVLLVIGNTPRLKQLAQTIRGNSKNLGLNNTIFGRVKQVRLSSILQHSLHGGEGSAPSPSPSPTPLPHHPHPHPHHPHHHHHHHHHHHDAHAPAISPVPPPKRSSTAPVDDSPAPSKISPAPHNNREANPPGCQFGHKRRFTGNGRKRSHLAPSGAPSSPPHSAASPQPDDDRPKVSPAPSPISNAIPASSPLPSVVFAHAQPPSRGKSDEQPDTIPSFSPSLSLSSCE